MEIYAVGSVMPNAEQKEWPKRIGAFACRSNLSQIRSEQMNAILQPQLRHTMKKANGKTFEIFTKWYLRFNGYFTVDNFIIHAADDSTRIRRGTIGNYSDIDVLAVRLPYHIEFTGELEIKNHSKLDCIEKTDIIIAECKTGEQNRPNKIWSDQNNIAIEYLLRYCGQFRDDTKVKEVANALLSKLKYEDNNCRIRLILFAQKLPPKEWTARGLTYISCSDMLDFFVEDRGECWVREDLGNKSAHESWDALIKTIFKIANGISDRESRKSDILNVLRK